MLIRPAAMARVSWGLLTVAAAGGPARRPFPAAAGPAAPVLWGRAPLAVRAGQGPAREWAAPARPVAAPEAGASTAAGACQIFCVSWGSRCPFVTLLRVVSGVRVRRGHGRGT